MPLIQWASTQELFKPREKETRIQREKQAKDNSEKQEYKTSPSASENIFSFTPT